MARIAVREEIVRQGHAVHERRGCEVSAQVVDRDLGTQTVDRQSSCQIGRQRCRAVEQETIWHIGRGRRDDEEVDQYLALWAQEGRVARFIRRKPINIVGHQSLKESPGVDALDLDDAAAAHVAPCIQCAITSHRRTWARP